ncbi:MAG: C39 family peptidase [Candidatus Caldatribacteriaceae bacterium]
MRKWYGLLVVVGFAVAIFSGCSSQVGLLSPDSEVNASGFSRFLENSGNRIILDVPFLPQVPPGDWSNTRNCGVASAVMIKAYYFGTTPTPQDIVTADEWLNGQFGLPINNYNGDFTNVFYLRSFLEAQGISTRIGMGNLEVLRSLLLGGKPVLVAVFSNLNLNGAKHAMLAVGMEGDSVLLHDPGKTNGAYNIYPVSQFLRCWQAQNNWYLTMN